MRLPVNPAKSSATGGDTLTASPRLTKQRPNWYIIEHKERRRVLEMIFDNNDVRLEPRYTLSEASRYVWVNAETLRTWAKGRFYHAGGERRRAGPVLDDSRGQRLSFMNLIEGHVLAALRQTHQVPMQKIRKAVEWIKERYRAEYPLLHPDLATDGLDIFIREFGRIISASEQGQVVMRAVMERYLSRIERDREGIPIQFYPFTRKPGDDTTPRFIVIDPSVAFGRPVLDGTRIALTIIIERFTAGESPESLATDYSLPLDRIYEALRTSYERTAA